MGGGGGGGGGGGAGASIEAFCLISSPISKSLEGPVLNYKAGHLHLYIGCK